MTFLNTATLGLPPRRSWAALQEALITWRAGTTDPVAYDAPPGRRSGAVRPAGGPAQLAGLVAACVPDGSEVLNVTVRPEFMDGLIPHAAGWYAGAEPWSSIYGGPLHLAPDARRFDMSPAWHSWVAAAPALELLAGLGTDALHAHALSLADRFCAGVGLASTGSAIVSLLVDDDAARAMKAARIMGSVRAGRLRLSLHVSTGEHDVDHAIEVLRRHVVRV